MSAALALSIPPPASHDSEDVTWALSTATSLWNQGQHEEALKWLRRAADAANESSDVRALELFKAAAHLRSTIPPSDASPDSSTRLTPVGSREPMLSDAARERDEISRSSLIPPPPRNPTLKGLPLSSPPPSSRIVRAPSKPGVPAPKPGVPAPKAAAPAPKPAAARPAPPAAPTQPPPPSGRPAPPPPPLVRPGSTRERAQITAVRVAVIPGPTRAEARIVALPLGAAPPPGAAVATLVPGSDVDVAVLARLLA